jgi:hypothetical protein
LIKKIVKLKNFQGRKKKSKIKEEEEEKEVIFFGFIKKKPRSLS